MRIIGLDPGLRRTGWGVIEARGPVLSAVAQGTVTPPPELPLAERLRRLHDGLQAVLAEWRPQAAAVEETFMTRNGESTLKLGFARGVVLLVPALCGLEVAEYAPVTVKKAVVGTGRADKAQMLAMVCRLLPRAEVEGFDAADALAVAICHAHHAQTRARLAAAAL